MSESGKSRRKFLQESLLTITSGVVARPALASILEKPSAPAGTAEGWDSGKQIRIPPKRSSQIRNGFGINVALPREPYLPWTQWWWTRMFDAGVCWVRIGQYENSTDKTSWDWVEREKGKYALPPEVDDYIDSLVEGGIKIQLQLLYGNPLYTPPAGRLPTRIRPAPASIHPPDKSLYSVYWPPKNPDERTAFLNYAKWVVNHFRGRIQYYALWNEPNYGFWNGSAEGYGRLLSVFPKSLHEVDATAKIILAGSDNFDYPKRALAISHSAPEIDVYSYHCYPGLVHQRNEPPEPLDAGPDRSDQLAKLRDQVRHYPGIRPDIKFWNDEFNALPSYQNMDESVQAKYVARWLVYNWTVGVTTFIWELVPGVDGNEDDEFGIIHGMRYLSDDFKPRPVFYAFQNVNTLFSDTKLDTSIRVVSPEIPRLESLAHCRFYAHGFRAPSGKAIVAFWLAARSLPGNQFPHLTAKMTLKQTGIESPVLIDITSGTMEPLKWAEGTTDVLDSVPVKDSILAIADRSFFDWPVLPETPSSLAIVQHAGSRKLAWKNHGDLSTGTVIERRQSYGKSWQKLAELPADAEEFLDHHPSQTGDTYRVYAVNAEGRSAYSNYARLAG